MKKKTVSKSLSTNTKCETKKSWLWIVLFVLIGGIAGYTTHYLIVNWHGFFVTCMDGTRPDKHGCCSGEVYTDAGDGWMVCCPNDSDNCFPPLK